MQELITRDVIFHEDVFPLSHQSPSVFPSHSEITETPNLPSSSTDFSPNTSDSASSTHHSAPSSSIPHTNNPSSLSDPDTNNSLPNLSRTGRKIKAPSHLTDFICNSVSSATPYPISSYFTLSKLSPEYLKYIILMSAIYEPTTYAQASQYPEWQEAMQEELAAFLRTETWFVTVLSSGKIPIDCKWVYKVKYNPDASVERFKARLVAKRFTQLEGVDFLDTFRI